MADNADRANDLVLERMEQALAARTPVMSRMAVDCEDCGDPIPPKRLEAMKGQGCTLCLECQGYHERRVG